MAYKCTKCPECGINLRGIDNVKHAVSHWGVQPNELHRLENKDARDRYEELTALRDDNKQEA